MNSFDGQFLRVVVVLSIPVCSVLLMGRSSVCSHSITLVLSSHVTSLEEMKTITTPSTYTYSAPVWVKSYVNSGAGSLMMFFEVTAAHDAHIWLSDGGNDKRRGYEIVIGGWNNARSVIRRGQQGVAELTCAEHTPDNKPLAENEARKFWISLIESPSSVKLVVGRGWDAWQNKFLAAIDSSVKRVKVESVAVSTGFKAEGLWTFLSIDSADHVPVKRDAGTPPKGQENVVQKPANSLSVKLGGITVKNTILTPSSGLLKRPRSGPQSPLTVSLPFESNSAKVASTVDKAIARFSTR